MRIKYLIPALWVLLIVSNITNATTITVVNQDGSNEGFNDNSAAVAGQTGNTGQTLGQQRLQVFQAAADYWEAIVISNVPINIDGNMDPLFCTSSSAVLGSAGPTTVHGSFPNAPLALTWYPQALANSIAGSDLDPTTNDIGATFNSDIHNNPACLASQSWWLGINSPAPSGTISLYETVLHEIGHGLGMLSLVAGNDGAKFNDFNDAYMYHLYDLSASKYWRNMTNAERVTSSVNNGNLVWRGATANNNSSYLTAGKKNGFIKMFAPNPYQNGSSVSHWDTSLSPNELMEPYATPTPDSTSTIGLMKDIGWDIVEEPGTLSFDSTVYSGTEGNTLKINVTRTLGSKGTVSVSINSSDGTATGGVDFDSVFNQTLTWADDDIVVKSFNIPLISDETEEPNAETATLTLSNPTGGAILGSASSATIKISDDDDFLLLLIPAITAKR